MLDRIAPRAAVSLALIGCNLVGCTLPTRAPDVITRDALQLRAWQANGRIAVSGAEAGGSGSFTWQWSGRESQVNLRGPVGVGSLRLLLADDALSVQTGDGRELVAEEARTELTARLGAVIPTSQLRYWLVGVPAPGEHAWTATADTALLEQQDWRIDYQRFAVWQGVRLPMKLQATSGSAKVRIVIDKWKVE